LGGAQVGQVLPGGGQDVGQVVRGVAGVSQLGARGGDDPAGVGTGVGPDASDVVFRAQPPVELVQQLREPVGEQGQLADQPVELGRPGEGAGIAGAVVELSQGLGSLLGQLQGVPLCVHVFPPV
jgi:hypothetical protein